LKSAANVISQDSSNYWSKSQTVSILKECHRFSLSIVNMESWPFSIFWETKILLLADDTWTMRRREHKNSRSVTCRWKWLQYKWHERHPSTFLETTELLIGVILSDCSLWNLWIKLSRMVYGNGGEDTILNLPQQMFSEKSIDLPWLHLFSSWNTGLRYFPLYSCLQACNGHSIACVPLYDTLGITHLFLTWVLSFWTSITFGFKEEEITLH
jgi:hypothetical protein